MFLLKRNTRPDWLYDSLAGQPETVVLQGREGQVTGIPLAYLAADSEVIHQLVSSSRHNDGQKRIFLPDVEGETLFVYVHLLLYGSFIVKTMMTDTVCKKLKDLLRLLHSKIKFDIKDAYPPVLSIPSPQTSSPNVSHTHTTPPIEPKMQPPVPSLPSSTSETPTMPSDTAKVAETKKKIASIKSLGSNTVTIKDGQLIVQGPDHAEATAIARKLAAGEAKLGNVGGKQVLIMMGGQEEADSEVTEELPEVTEGPPKSTEELPKSTEELPKSTEEPLKSTPSDLTGEEWACSFIHKFEVKYKLLKSIKRMYQ